MSEDVEIVRRGIEAWNRRDVAGALAGWSPDAEIDWSRSLGPLKGIYRGHQGLKTFWNEFWSTFEMVKIETHGFTLIRSNVVVPNTAHLRGRDGIEVIARSTFVFTVENGLTTSLRLFQRKAEALDAANRSRG